MAADIQVLQKLGFSTVSFKDQTALVTGAARGIGKEVVLALSYLGAKVFAVDKNEITYSDESGNIIPVLCDLSKTEQVDSFCEKVGGEIDLLIHNAAFAKVLGFEKLSHKDWDEHYKNNLFPVVYLTEKLLPSFLEKKKGVILNIVSADGIPYLSPYSAMKAGIRSFFLSLNEEFKSYKELHFVGFGPGFVDTELANDIIEKISKEMGITFDDFMKAAVDNPGYEGFIPPTHSAAGVCYILKNAKLYRGHTGDSFSSLKRYGVIDFNDKPKIDENDFQSTKRYVKEVVELNDNLEEMIKERTLELARTQESAQQAAQFASLGEFASTMAHEINNPLQVILGAASQLSKYCDKGEVDKVKSKLDLLVRNCEKVNKITTSLLRIYRKDPLETSSFSKILLKQHIEDAISICRFNFLKSQVNFKLAPFNEEIILNSLGPGVSQVIVNLLKNSYDAVSNFDEKWISLDVKEDQVNQKVKIIVSDSGTIIKEDIREKMFNSFFTTKGVGKGTGLGLSISKKIAKRHGGDLYYTKEFGKNQFILEVPALYDMTIPKKGEEAGLSLI